MIPNTIFSDKKRFVFQTLFTGMLVFIWICLFAGSSHAIEARAGDGEAHITWIAPTKNEDGTPLTDLKGYYIYRTENPSHPYKRLNEEAVKGICYTDTGLLNGITYYYAVTAVDFFGNESQRSPVVSITPNILPPSNFKAKPGDGEIQLLWEPYEKSDIKGYLIYRRGALDTEFKKITDIPVPAQQTHYIDSSVANGIAYFYMASCVGMDGMEGLQSQEAGATPLAIIPGELVSVKALYIREQEGISYVKLTWEESQEENVTGYNVYRRLKTERDFTRLTPDPIKETYYNDTTVSADKGYLYSVVAVTGGGMETRYPREAECFTSEVYISSFSHDTGGMAKKAGDEICFMLRGEPGAFSSYKIEGLTSQLPMEEINDGVYKSCLKITQEMSIDQAKATGFLEDKNGNMTSVAANKPITIDNEPPGPVYDSKAILDLGIVKITWKSPDGEHSGFDIFRKELVSTGTFDSDPDAGELIAKVQAGNTSHYDSAVKPDRDYIYTISAVDRAGNLSTPSSTPSVHVPYQEGIPVIEKVIDNTAGLPQKTGNKIHVELTGEEGCQAGFFIQGVFEGTVPMTETEPGRYSGDYIIRPEDTSEEALIRGCLQDDMNHFNIQNSPNRFPINFESNDTTPPLIYEISHNAFEISGFSGHLVPGNHLDITLRGEPGCKALFAISNSDITAYMKDGGSVSTPESCVIFHEMSESEDYPGQYSGGYTIKWEDGTSAEKWLWICLADKAGNLAYRQSDETLSIDARPRIEVIPADKALWVDQESKTRITVKVTDANGNPAERHLIALTLTTTDEYTGVVGGGDFGRRIDSDDMGIDFDQETDSWGEVEIEYSSGFAAKTALIVAKDLTTGHAGAGYILNILKAQTDIFLYPPARFSINSLYKLILTADPGRLTADGVSTSMITAQLADISGNPEKKEGLKISFHLSDENNGTLSYPREVHTDSYGQASIRYTAGIIRGTVTIAAFCESNDRYNGACSAVDIALMSDAPAILKIHADPNYLTANGSEESTVKVWVADINKNSVQQAVVEFYILQDGMGRLSDITRTTDFNGLANCTYTSPALSGYLPAVATIQAKITSRVPDGEEMAKALGTIFVPLIYTELKADEELKILEWLYKKGDDIKEGSPIVRISTQKGDFSLNAPVSGQLIQIKRHRREGVRLGQTLGLIRADDEYLELD
ncbi:hypothetical protein JXL19_07985 [bacterium]|nr:hypothetical protein [bacterium]